jgi:hypothetical protein
MISRSARSLSGGLMLVVLLLATLALFPQDVTIATAPDDNGNRDNGSEQQDNEENTKNDTQSLERGERNIFPTLLCFDGLLNCSGESLITGVRNTSGVFLSDAEQTGSIGGASYGLTMQGDIAYLGEGTSVSILDVSDVARPQKLANLTFPSLVWDMDIEGSLLFVANGNTGGVQIVNVTTPATPHIVGHYDTPGVALRVDAVGNYAYIADSIGGMHILDVSTPVTPTLLGSYTEVDAVLGVHVDGTIAYVSDISLGLLVLDVSNPAVPTLIGSYTGPYYSNNLYLEDNLVYMTHYIPDPPYDPEKPHTPDDEIHIVDVSTPTAPTLVGSYKGLEYPENFAVSNSIVYVADGIYGVKIVDATDSSAPFLSGQYPSAGHAQDVVVQGDRAYVAADKKGLFILDVSQPTVPTLLGNYDVIGWVYDVHLHEGYTYLATGTNGFSVVDSEQQSVVETFSFPDKHPGMIIDIGADGNTAYVQTINYDLENPSASFAMLRTYDISTPAAPVPLGSCEIPMTSRDMEVEGNNVYFNVFDKGLYLVDVSDPTNPVLSATSFQYYVSDMQIDQSTAYVADTYLLQEEEGGPTTLALLLSILDMSNPISPTVVAAEEWLLFQSDYSLPVSIAVYENKAYISLSYTPILLIIDVKPDSETFLSLIGLYGESDTLSFTGDIAVSKGRAYIVSETDRNDEEIASLAIFDVSNPSEPVLLGSYESSDWDENYVHPAPIGDYVYLSTGDNRLDVLDVSDPSNPRLASSYETSPFYTGLGNAYAPVGQVKIVGSRAFLAANAKFDILDVSDPSNPTYVGGRTEAHPGDATTITTGNGLIYLGGEGLDIISKQGPNTFQILSHYPHFALDVRVAESLLYSADGIYGLHVFDVSTPTHPQIIGHYDTSGYTTGVYIEGTKAYIADGPDGLHILDVENLAAIERLGSYDTPGYAFRVQVKNNVAYVVDGEEVDDGPTGLQMIDVSVPENPRFLGSYNTPSEALDVFVDGDMAYVSTSKDGIHILDVSKPITPTLRDQISTPGTAWGIEKVGDTFHVANYQAGYQIIRYTEPVTKQATYLPLVIR